MGILIALLVVAAIVGGLVVRHWHQQEQLNRLRDRARLRIIEGQLAALRAGLRIGMAEHAARQALGDELRRLDVFRNSTDHEEYRPS
jgi:hypothetical protein